jgi:hypothetical protein
MQLIYTISLCGEWNARLDPKDTGLAENIAARPLYAEFTVPVPGCLQQLPELAGGYPSMSGTQNGYKGTWFLEKTFDLPDMSDGMLVIITLGGVSSICHAWLNGRYIGRHAQTATQARFDATEAAQPNALNRLTIAITEETDSSMYIGYHMNDAAWSGLYREAHVSICPSVWAEGVYIACGAQGDTACGILHNDGPAWDETIHITLADRRASLKLKLDAGESREFSIPMDTSGLARWSPGHPALHPLVTSIGWRGDEVLLREERTGLRRVYTDGPDVRLDAASTLMLGTGQEYFSPAISPLVDRELIRNRWEAVCRFGFNFFRFHTYVPTEEELDAADEAGLMVSAEIGIVSNFNKALPAQSGLEMLKQFILLTRRHPSLIVYCLGNEGSQLMVTSETDREHARQGYRLVKETTSSQLCMIAFGMQGELPDLPNDIESPHLWSDNFLWAYEGLTDIPWKLLAATTHGKPAIVHEYGKFGVWPDRDEFALMPARGMSSASAEQAAALLDEWGIGQYLPILINNSRRLSVDCTRIILEEARRQPYLRGFTLWTFFRKLSGNAGLADDMALHFNCDPGLFAKGCNAPAAVLIDRGFRGRCVKAGVSEPIEVTISNFGGSDLTGVEIGWQLKSDNETLDSGSATVSIPSEQTQVAARVSFMPPADIPANKMARLDISLANAGMPIASNSWNFWIFAQKEPVLPDTLLACEGGPLLSALKQALPGAHRVRDAHSILAGCRSWQAGDITAHIPQIKGAVAVAHRLDELTRSLYNKYMPVLLLDDGHFPKEWIQSPIMSGMDEDDPSRFYSSFRAGWDSGNLASVINDPYGMISGFPHEGFCGLQFYELMNRAAPLNAQAIARDIGGSMDIIIETFTKLRITAQREALVQDPNAAKEIKSTQRRREFDARRQAYLIDIHDGGKRMAVCSLRLAGHMAGEALLRMVVRCLGGLSS